MNNNFNLTYFRIIAIVYVILLSHSFIKNIIKTSKNSNNSDVGIVLVFKCIVYFHVIYYLFVFPKFLVSLSKFSNLKNLITILNILFSFHSIYILYKAFKLIKTKKKTTLGNTKILNEKEVIIFNAVQPIIITNIYRGLLISGGAGSGKSASFVYSLLQQMVIKDYTGIVYDFKNPELIEFVKRVSLAHNSQTKLIIIDFKNPQKSSRINLLQGLTKIAEVKELSTALWKNLNNDAIKNPGSFWNTSAEAILTATMFSLIKSLPKYATVPHALAIIFSLTLDELIKFLSLNFQAKGLVTQLINSYKLGSNNQTSGSIGTLTNYLGVLNTPENFYILSGNEMPEPNNPKNPSILLLGNDSTLSDTISPILAMVVTAVIRKMNKPNQKKSLIVIDELPTLFLPTLKQLPAVARSNKIATCVTVQDKSQLEDTYSLEEAKVTIGNLSTQIYGRSTLESTNKYISNLFGKHDVEYASRSTGQSGNLKNRSSSNSTSYSFQQRNRIEPQEILNFKPGQFCGIVAEGTPNEFLSNQVVPFDTSPYYSFEANETKNTPYKTIEDNYNKIYNDVELIRKWLKNE